MYSNFEIANSVSFTTDSCSKEIICLGSAVATALEIHQFPSAYIIDTAAALTRYHGAGERGRVEWTGESIAEYDSRKRHDCYWAG